MKKQKLLTLLAVTMAVVLAASANAAIEVTPEHIVSGSATGSLMAIDAPTTQGNRLDGPLGPDWPDDADDGFELLAGAILYPEGGGRIGWEPDGTDDSTKQVAFQYGGAGTQVKWTFDLPDGAIIHNVYGRWHYQGNSGSGHTWTYDEGTLTTFVQAAGGSAGDLVLQWTAADMDTHNANFQKLFSGPTLVAGGDGFAVTFTHNGGYPYPEAVVIDYTVPVPLGASPKYGETITTPFGEGSTEDEVKLSWINLDPCTPGDPVHVDVWWGTDPNKVGGDYEKVTLADGVDELKITILVDGTYYWQVDTYFGSDPCAIEGTVNTFNVLNDAAPTAEIYTANTMTWSGMPVALLAAVGDEDMDNLVYGWTAEPNGLDDPDLNIEFIPDAGTESPTVTITNTTGSMVTVTLTLTAEDATYDPVTASVEIDVYTDACDMAVNGQGKPIAEGDVNADCIIDLKDLAEMASTWLNDSSTELTTVDKS